MALRNDCDVGHYGSSSHNTLDHLVAAEKLYQELKNSSGKHPLALPMIPSSRFLINPVYLQDTTLDLEYTQHP